MNEHKGGIRNVFLKIRKWWWKKKKLAQLQHGTATGSSSLTLTKARGNACKASSHLYILPPPPARPFSVRVHACLLCSTTAQCVRPWRHVTAQRKTKRKRNEQNHIHEHPPIRLLSSARTHPIRLTRGAIFLLLYTLYALYVLYADENRRLTCTPCVPKKKKPQQSVNKKKGGCCPCRVAWPQYYSVGGHRLIG